MARRADPGRREYWQELIEAQASSGMSVLEYCLKRKVSTASFYGWKRRLAGRTSKPTAAAMKLVNNRPGASNFVAIDLPAMPGVPSSHCEVLLVDGRRVRIPAGFDRESLIDLLAALGATM